ncbi:class I SAM-dependent methyltransferase [Flavobacteriaceae bacterium]|nr:class I SAM-dependent methyltransferase [Flavobacteriaceae bacterium]MDB2631603.1 class I SAM-dependent methyltransferase [Flavobacteriaceae bacterium]
MKKSEKLYLKTKDFSITGEPFALCFNKELDMLVTTPQPKAEHLSNYYNSELYISHLTKKRSPLDWVYFLVRNYTLRSKIKLISKFSVHKKTLLDFGAGSGFFVRATTKAGWKSIGIETSKDAREAANIVSANSIFSNSHIDKMELNTVSVITLWHVLEHLLHPDLHIEKFKQLLTKDGRLVVAVPNYKSYDAAYFKEFWAAYDVPRHLWHFSQKSISRLFSQHDFEIETIHPMRFDAYYVSLLSTKYKYGKMKIFKALWLGFVSNVRAQRTGEYSSLIYVLKHNDN